MPRYDFRSPRIYLDARLAAGAAVALDRDQANHLRNVLRLGNGDMCCCSTAATANGGPSLAGSGKKALTAILKERVREQPRSGDLHFMFAPLKHARLDYLVQKAVEMGATRLQPVITRHTQVTRINLGRMRANVIEAAQQCGVLALPEVAEPAAFDQAVADAGRMLVFCDEDAPSQGSGGGARRCARRPAAGGAHRSGRRLFRGGTRGAAASGATSCASRLGPRILRADTAAVAALALVQAGLGDWRS